MAEAHKRVMIVAGEMSGDHHAAQLIRDLRAVRSDVEFFGIGGDAMRREGVRTLVDERDMSVLGFFEVMKRYPFFRRIFKQMTEVLAKEKPDALLLVDYPGFNLRLAAEAHALGIPVLYYISPQVWAWHKSRIPKMAEILDLLMVIFPFEVEVFKGSGLKAVFVGHPLVDSVRKTMDQAETALPWPSGGGRRVAILAGSRRQSMERNLPVMLDTAKELRRRDPTTVFLIAAASEEVARLAEAQLAARPADERAGVGVVTGQMRDVVRQSRAAMVCSGTATLETALLKCPMIVVNVMAALTYWIGKRLIQVEWLGLANLVLNRNLCPEFIQHDAQPVAMADELERLIADTPARQAQLDGMEEVARALEGVGHVQPAGQVVAEALG